jgi:thioredoxin 1
MATGSFEQLVNSSTPVLVDFFATWCGPCQMMGPVLEQLKQDLGDQITIVKIDVDKNSAIAGQFQVRGVPTFMIFQNGEAKWRQSGMLSLSDLKNVLTPYLA